MVNFGNALSSYFSDINAVGPDDVEQTTEALSTAVDDIDFTTSVSPGKFLYITKE